MPDLLARIVVPWLLDRGLLNTRATTTRTGTAPAVRVDFLRYGVKGPAVRAWQELLRARGYLVAVDGDFGPATVAATKALQRAAGLVVDGVVGPGTRASSTAISSRRTSASSTAPPLSEAEKDALFGVVAWVPQEPPAGAVRITNSYRTEFGEVEVPELRGVLGAPASGRVVLHRLAAARLVELFAAWREAGLLDRVRAWSGGLAIRRVRGGTALSSHARGIAFDINAPGLPLGKRDPGAGAPWSVEELAEIAGELGWFWGERFSRPDPMHFERRAE